MSQSALGRIGSPLWQPFDMGCHYRRFRRSGSCPPMSRAPPIVGSKCAGARDLRVPGSRDRQFPVRLKKFPVMSFRKFGKKSQRTQPLRPCESATRRLNLRKFPVFSLFNREMAAPAPETGSQQTLYTASIQRIDITGSVEALDSQFLQKSWGLSGVFASLLCGQKPFGAVWPRVRAQMSRFLSSAVPPSRATGAISWSGKANTNRDALLL